MVKRTAQTRPNLLLRAARKQRGWTQQEVADRIGAPFALTVARWERGSAMLGPLYIERLCQIFDKRPQDLGLLQSADEGSGQWRPLFNVPFQRNPFFTGRETELVALHERLNQESRVALCQSLVISGLGGIGKTQTAIEYAYRYRDNYQAIFWVRAGSVETLITDFLALSGPLQLPGQESKDQMALVAEVRRWLNLHEGWLLILDNADDLSFLPNFLPTGNAGHILLTTRTQATGQLAPSMAIERLRNEEGALLLLRRAKLVPPHASLATEPATRRSETEAIVEALGGLPLALDQAAAYIEETGCSLSQYLTLYQQDHRRLLQRQSAAPSAYPHTVASTWALCFQQVEQTSPVAADMLRLCTFLHPDAIPEALVTTEGMSPFHLNEAMGVLRRYSLLKRDAEARLLTIHRLVQTVLKDSLEPEVCCYFAERAVRAVHAAFPEPRFEHWADCEIYLPHALVCAGQIEQYHLCIPEAFRLLSHTGEYLRERGQYSQAESLLRDALALCQQAQGANHLETAAILSTLGWLYHLQGRYEQAEPLLSHALSIREEALGPAHADVAEARNNLAYLYQAQGKFEQAEPLYQRALAILSHASGPDQPDVAQAFNNLAELYQAQGRYEQAEPLYQRALAIFKQTMGPQHPDTAISLTCLAFLYVALGKFKQAELLHQQALTIFKQTVGPHHPYTGRVYNNLAELYQAQGKFERATAFYQHALAIYDQALDHMHPHVAQIYDNLAELYRLQSKFEQAEPLYQQALAIREKTGGPDHPDTASTLNHLAQLYLDQGRYEQARPLYQRALAIREKRLGPQHPDTIATFRDYNNLVCKLQGESKGTQHVAPARKKYPAGLTVREVEVLGLVAAGLTSSQIAERLSVSLLTINSHIRSIYSKLGVTSRSAATRYAIEHHLEPGDD